MWALFLMDDVGSKRFAWLEGSSVLMKEAQVNVKSQKNTFSALPGLPKVGGADCSRINEGSTQEGKDGMVRTWLASKPTTGATFCGGSAQDGTDSMVETWLASKPTTFRSESLPCTSYPRARSMSSSSADIEMKSQHDFSTEKFLPGASYARKRAFSSLSADLDIGDQHDFSTTLAGLLEVEALRQADRERVLQWAKNYKWKENESHNRLPCTYTSIY